MLGRPLRNPFRFFMEKSERPFILNGKRTGGKVERETERTPKRWSKAHSKKTGVVQTLVLEPSQHKSKPKVKEILRTELASLLSLRISSTLGSYLC